MRKKQKLQNGKKTAFSTNDAGITEHFGFLETLCIFLTSEGTNESDSLHWKSYIVYWLTMN